MIDIITEIVGMSCQSVDIPKGGGGGEVYSIVACHASLSRRRGEGIGSRGEQKLKNKRRIEKQLVCEPYKVKCRALIKASIGQIRLG